MVDAVRENKNESFRKRMGIRGPVVLSGLLGVLLAALLVGFTALDEGDAQTSKKKPGARNIILLIGDGMAESEITIARNYHLGADGRFALDTLPNVGDYTTYSVQESDPSAPEYYPESASTATAWSTGEKTSNGRLSTAPGTGEELTTIMELARDEGFRTGDVTTARLTDATPAAPTSHVDSRSCEGPTDPASLTTCSADRSIAEQQVDGEFDVLLGGGRAKFEQTIDNGAGQGQTVLQYAEEEQDYNVVDTAQELEAAEPGQKLLGLFNADNMSLEWSGLVAIPFPGSGPQECQEDQRPANEPSLAAMTTKAIELLERDNARKPGFFLQVEGASIDKQDHAANPCGQIGENVAFDAAVKVALDYQKSHPRTLVIVTGDHAHTSQIVSLTQETPGLSSVLTTADGVNMRVNYGTGTTAGNQQHTGSQIRVAGKGPSADRIEGLTDQTDLFDTMTGAIGVG